MPAKESLETKLTKNSWISPAQYCEAKTEQKKVGKSLYSCLIKLGFLTEEKLYLFFSATANIPFVKLDNYSINRDLVDMFPESLYREHVFIPFVRLDKVLYLCMANPLDTDLINMINMQTHLEVEPLFVCVESINKAIDSFFGPDDKYFNMEDLVISPQTIDMGYFWRESDRTLLDTAVEFKITDKRLGLAEGRYILSVCSDISASGRAIGIKTSFFVPPGIRVSLKFPSKDPDYEVLGEVVRCTTSQDNSCSLAVTFLEVKQELIDNLLKEANTSK